MENNIENIEEKNEKKKKKVVTLMMLAGGGIFGCRNCYVSCN